MCSLSRILATEYIVPNTMYSLSCILATEYIVPNLMYSEGCILTTMYKGNSLTHRIQPHAFKGPLTGYCVLWNSFSI